MHRTYCYTSVGKEFVDWDSLNLVFQLSVHGDDGLLPLTHRVSRSSVKGAEVLRFDDVEIILTDRGEQPDHLCVVDRTIFRSESATPVVSAERLWNPTWVDLHASVGDHIQLQSLIFKRLDFLSEHFR